MFDGSSSSRCRTRSFDRLTRVGDRLWQRQLDWVNAHANCRDKFKPAVIDFGPESEGGVLQPETARSAEPVLKGQHLHGRLSGDLSAFHMRLRHLVVAQAVNGLPSLTNAGSEHFTGAELDGHFQLTHALSVVATYAHHDARFGNYVQLYGSTPVQLQGKYLQLSPRTLASAGFTYAPRAGLSAYAVADFNGSHFLDQRNTARAGGYTTLDAGIGYRQAAWEVRLDGRNLSSRRDAVAASELGVDQLYLLPARSLQLSASYRFDAG